MQMDWTINTDNDRVRCKIQKRSLAYAASLIRPGENVYGVSIGNKYLRNATTNNYFDVDYDKIQTIVKPNFKNSVIIWTDILKLIKNPCESIEISCKKFDSIIISVCSADFNLNDILNIFNENHMIVSDLPSSELKNHLLIRGEVATPKNLFKNLLCTGCGVCSKRCPSNAITICKNNYGYYAPIVDYNNCIKCNMCVAICPAINHEVSSEIQDPRCFAVVAPDQIWKHSTSGGFFSLIAIEVLRRNGIIYGAAWTDTTEVSIIRIDNSLDLNKLNYSKYIQSSALNSYDQVKEDLDKGNHVLYSGLPCQVAALKQYLKTTDCSNLITVDILCRGVPSNESLQKYLFENYNFNNIAQVTYRKDKINTRFIELSFKDNTTQILEDNDNYVKCLFKERILFGKHSCKYCTFARLPRQGEITIGDFWGIKKFNKNFPDPGTSLVLGHTSRGIDLIQCTLKNAKQVGYDYDYLSTPNRILGEASYSVFKSIEFYDYLKSHSFNKSFEYIISGIADVGIVCISTQNYGNQLTYYALYKLITNLNKTVVIIYPPKEIQEHDPQLFLKSPFPKYISKKYSKLNEMEKLNNDCKMFILGSDQFLRDKFVKKYNFYQLMGWVYENRYKCIFSASTGSEIYQGNAEFMHKSNLLLNRIDAISMRERSGCDILKNTFGIDSSNTLDPVLLLEPHSYEPIYSLGMGLVPPKPYFFSFFIISTKPRELLHQEISKQIPQLSPVYINLKNVLGKEINSKGQFDCTVNEWLALIKNCNYLVTDSFHAVCFAVLFKRPFVVLYEPWQPSRDRIASFLKQIGLYSRLLEDPENIKLIETTLQTPIDYVAVQDKLNPLIKNSLCTLRTFIETGLSEDLNIDFHPQSSEVGENENNCKSGYDHQIKVLNERISTLEKLVSELYITKNSKN